MPNVQILIKFLYHSCWQIIVFKRNTITYKREKKPLQDGVMAKYVRFWPKTYQRKPCMRVEIFGEEASPGIYHNHKCST